MNSSNFYNINSNDELLKIVDLLSEALKFYANDDTYKYNSSSGSLIDKDKGFQAKFILEKINELIKNKELTESNLNNYLNVDNIDEYTIEDFNEILIDKLKIYNK